MLKGPTGCGKTRFVEHMAWRLRRPLVTVACHDDLSASDLTGRWLVKGGETVWQDGPLTRAARMGAICYLDEVVEARQDVVVVIHPLTDDRRMLPLEKTGELIEAVPGFQLVISYNPGYQHVLKDLKPSTRQRFVSLEFDFPPVALERRIVAHEGGVERAQRPRWWSWRAGCGGPRPGPRRGAEQPAPRVHCAAHQRRHRPGPGLSSRPHGAAHRRPRPPRCNRRSHHSQYLTDGRAGRRNRRRGSGGRPVGAGAVGPSHHGDNRGPSPTPGPSPAPGVVRRGRVS